MNEPEPPRTDVRKTVSLDQVIWDWAQRLMREKGYNKNFSAYVAELIRQDQKRQVEDLKAELAWEAGRSPQASRSRYPSPSSQLNEVQERPAAAAPPPKKKNAA